MPKKITNSTGFANFLLFLSFNFLSNKNYVITYYLDLGTYYLGYKLEYKQKTLDFYCVSNKIRIFENFL